MDAAALVHHDGGVACARLGGFRQSQRAVLHAGRRGDARHLHGVQRAESFHGRDGHFRQRHRVFRHDGECARGHVLQRAGGHLDGVAHEHAIGVEGAAAHDEGAAEVVVRHARERDFRRAGHREAAGDDVDGSRIGAGGECQVAGLHLHGARAAEAREPDVGVLARDHDGVEVFQARAEGGELHVVDDECFRAAHRGPGGAGEGARVGGERAVGREVREGQRRVPMDGAARAARADCGHAVGVYVVSGDGEGRVARDGAGGAPCVDVAAEVARVQVDCRAADAAGGVVDGAAVDALAEAPRVEYQRHRAADGCAVGSRHGGGDAVEGAARVGVALGGEFHVDAALDADGVGGRAHRAEHGSPCRGRGVGGVEAQGHAAREGGGRPVVRVQGVPLGAVRGRRSRHGDVDVPRVAAFVDLDAVGGVPGGDDAADGFSGAGAGVDLRSDVRACADAFGIAVERVRPGRRALARARHDGGFDDRVAVGDAGGCRRVGAGGVEAQAPDVHCPARVVGDGEAGVVRRGARQGFADEHVVQPDVEAGGEPLRGVPVDVGDAQGVREVGGGVQGVEDGVPPIGCRLR